MEMTNYGQALSAPVPRDAEEQALLLQLLRGYACGRSSSVPAEVAAAMLHSLRLTVQAAGGVGEAGCEAAYYTGLDLINRRVQRARRLWTANRRQLPFGASSALRLSFVSGLREFFQRYTPIHAAQEIPGTLDYLTAVPVADSLEGIFWIEQYITNLVLEASFCRPFPKGQVSALLGRFRQVFHLNYRESLENLFALLFDHAYLCQLTGEPVTTLVPDDAIRRLLPGAVAQAKAQGDYHRHTEEMFRTLSPNPQPELLAYLHRYTDRLALRLERALAENRLDSLALWPVQDIAPTYTPNPPMADSALRALLETLRDLPADRQAETILSQVDSLEDMVSIFESGCMTGEEIGVVISRLPEGARIELARFVRDTVWEMPGWYAPLAHLPDDDGG